MCFKVYVSVALCFACFLTFSEGFFLPVFVRKQAPQTPAVNSAQWASPPSSSSSGSNSQTPYNGLKEYNPYQQSHMTSIHQMTPLQPVSQMSQMSQMNQPMNQYNYEAAASMPMALPYPQMQSSFHSVQLVPCLCPISKEVIEQQTQQMQHSPPAPSSVESGNNAVTVQGSHKVNS